MQNVTKQLLRSGCPDDLYALGEQGHPVFDFAHQIREMLHLRGLDHICHLLAVPQRHAGRNWVDWYAPHTGNVIAWHAATDAKQSAALSTIAVCTREIQQLCSLSAEDHSVSNRLFIALLRRVLHYPDSQYLYFVDDQPVITFWGFAAHEQDADCVLPDLPVSLPALPQCMSLTGLSVSENGPEDNMLSVRQTAYKTPKKGAKGYYRYTVTGILLTLIACTIHSQRGSQTAIPPREIPLEWPEKKQGHIPSLMLPLTPATFTPGQTRIILPPRVTDSQAMSTSEPAPPQATLPILLTLPNQARRRGDTTFLDGEWQAEWSSEQGQKNVLHYRLKGGRGHITFQDPKNGTCRAGALAGWLPSGTLQIKPSTAIQCRSGQSVMMPTLRCNTRPPHHAACRARYSRGPFFTVHVQQVSP